MNNIRNITISIILVLICVLLSSCNDKQTVIISTQTKTDTPTQSPTKVVTPTNTNTNITTTTKTTFISLVGKWERHGKQNERTYTELFDVKPDGTYSIEAKFDDTGEILASTYGTYIFTETTLTLTDKDNKTTNSTYYVDATGNKLIIDNKPEIAWTRLQ
jgi:predicted glycosyl hydrolase (DUF1957 family)